MAALAIRSSVGIELWSSAGAKIPYEYNPEFPREETKNSRSISFSPSGQYFAYSNGKEIKVVRTSDWQLQCTLLRPKAFYIKFSPRGNYLCTWELYTVTKDKPEGAPNMFVYQLPTGSEVFAIVQKNQMDWEPSWSIDETVCTILVGGEALFYDLSEGAAGFATTTRKIGGGRGGILSLGPGSSPPYLAFYTPGAKGAPSMCKLYKYPALAQNQTVACKSFFQADKVEMLWNKRGSGLLLLTSTEVDKSGASYYGNQALHFMATKGDTCSVPLSKEGPVHCVKWSPKATEFVVVYGYMPSKAALYNSKCDVVFDFGEGPRNSAYFNAFGNLLVLAGFGNLPGNVEIWDVQKKEKLASMKCPDTTYFDWNPNGEYFLTATTAPRLRIGNGFKVYHYSGALMHETIWPQGQELLGVEWQQFPANTFAEPKITKAKQEGIKSSQPEASHQAYTPPHLRLLKEGKNPEKYVPQPKGTIPGLPGCASSQTNNKKGVPRSTNNLKSAKQKNKRTSISGQDDIVSKSSNLNGGGGDKSEEGLVKEDIFTNRKQQQTPKKRTSSTGLVPRENDRDIDNQESEHQMQPHQQKQDYALKKPANPEKEKKIRNVAKKLSDIKKLKARQDQGELLEINQVNKISMESKFLDELKSLKLSA